MKRRMGPVVSSALCYLVIGVASAVFSNPVETPGIQTALRITALLLGILVFSAHLRFEIGRLNHTARETAIRSCAAVALGSFLLASYTVLYNVIVRSRPVASIALVLVVWPIVTGALGFVAALVLARAVFWRRASHDKG